MKSTNYIFHTNQKGSGFIGMLVAFLLMGVFVVFIYNTFISSNSAREGVDGDPNTNVLDEAGGLRDGLEERHNKILDEI